MFSPNTHLFRNSVAEKFLCPSRFNTAGSGRATGGISTGSSLLSSSASLQWPLCQTAPPSWEQRTCSLISPSLITGRHPKLVPLPCHHWAGGSGVPHDSGRRTSPVTLHGPTQSRSRMSIKGIQPIAVAWMVLGAACTVTRAPWGGESMEKDFVNNPAQSSTTSFFNKCVTLPEKLLVFSSQTRLIFL